MTEIQVKMGYNLQALGLYSSGWSDAFHLQLGFHVTKINSGFCQNYAMIRLVTWFWSVGRKYQPRAWFLSSMWLGVWVAYSCIVESAWGQSKPVFKRRWIGKGLIRIKAEFFTYPLVASPCPAQHLSLMKGRDGQEPPTLSPSSTESPHLISFPPPPLTHQYLSCLRLGLGRPVRMALLWASQS